MSSRTPSSGTASRTGKSLTKTASSAPSREVVGYAPMQMRTPATRANATPKSQTAKSRSSRSARSRPSSTVSKTQSLPTRSDNTHWQTKMALASTVQPTASGTGVTSGVPSSAFRSRSKSSTRIKNSECKTYVPAKPKSSTKVSRRSTANPSIPSRRYSATTAIQTRPGLTKSWKPARTAIQTRPGLSKSWKPVSRSSVNLPGKSFTGSTRTSTYLPSSGYGIEEVVQEEKKSCCSCCCILVTFIILLLCMLLGYFIYQHVYDTSASDLDKLQIELKNSKLALKISDDMIVKHKNDQKKDRDEYKTKYAALKKSGKTNEANLLKQNQIQRQKTQKEKLQKLEARRRTAIANRRTADANQRANRSNDKANRARQEADDTNRENQRLQGVDSENQRLQGSNQRLQSKYDKAHRFNKAALETANDRRNGRGQYKKPIPRISRDSNNRVTGLSGFGDVTFSYK